MISEASKPTLLGLIEYACAHNNYDYLMVYGIIVRPDILRKEKVIIKYKGAESNCINNPETIKTCLKELFQIG
ncbi:hypothetical protein [Adhaeribacter arboris]|nr:hypothetical protein [Adhaeribacter arboris]